MRDVFFRYRKIYLQKTTPHLLVGKKNLGQELEARGKMEEKMDKAVALKYNSKENNAPVITASGRGQIARIIIEKAKENGVHIQEDPALIEVLSKLDIGSVIPPELYQSIAEVLAFIYRLDKSYQPGVSAKG